MHSAHANPCHTPNAVELKVQLITSIQVRPIAGTFRNPACSLKDKPIEKLEAQVAAMFCYGF
jgi:hypothetical protein